MSGHLLKCAAEARRLMPVFGLLFIALAGFCLTGAFAERRISEGDGTSPAAASLDRNGFTNGDSFKDFSNEFPTFAPRPTGWSPDKSKVGFNVDGANNFNPNGVGNRFGTLNTNQSFFR
jgi:hypothetical protein